MMKKSIIVFAVIIIFSVGVIVSGCIFVDGQTGEAALAEETIAGDQAEAESLVVGFRADASENLHWVNRYDYSTGQTVSFFKRGEMSKKTTALFYDYIRFTGWSAVPYYTRLDYGKLDGLQDKKIHAFYDDIQQAATTDGKKVQGEIRLADYIDYYPVSFRFQLGSKIFSSNNALTGMKVYEERGILSSDTAKAYDSDIALYAAFNKMFPIPVIGNEYHQYTVSKVKDYDYETELGYKMEVKKLRGRDADYYEFDPIIAIQEENIRDSVEWDHPDLGDAAYNLKNRLLFIVNNRTAKGNPVDTSQMKEGYGIYELPVEIVPEASLKKSPRSRALPVPKPLPDELKMVYPLDEKAEYVEMSLSNDHRYLAAFSVKDETYYVELIDADHWKSAGIFELFPASEKMTYAWGDDGCIAVTNHNGYLAVVVKTEEDSSPYALLYQGEVGGDIDKAFFDDKMVVKKNSYAKYQYGIDDGLAVAAKDGKAALVQSLLVGEAQADLRNAELACLVIDESGVVYRGRLTSNLVDYEYDISWEELAEIGGILEKGSGKKLKGKAIEPVGSENWAEWK